MAIPTFQEFMLPLLTAVGDGEEHTLQPVREKLADVVGLTAEERAELLPSGTQLNFHNRIGWAKTHLGKAGLIQPTGNGSFRITSAGQAVLAQAPDSIDVKWLNANFPEHDAWLKASRAGSNKPSKNGTPAPSLDDSATPQELIESGYRAMNEQLVADVRAQLEKSDPTFFEQIVIDVLLAMGYGGSRAEAGRAIGKSGDGGIDGTIDEDRLGLDRIYVQAKRWANVVGRPEIQKFAGALQGVRAKKGVFITTSGFSKEAAEYAGMIDARIVLIDGDRLARLMVAHNVGVSLHQTYEIKRVDQDYFAGE